MAQMQACLHSSTRNNKKILNVVTHVKNNGETEYLMNLTYEQQNLTFD
jgi:hypothetical protein